MKARLGWLCVALVLSLSVAGCGSNNSSAVTIAITPPSAIVLLGTSVQFIPSVAGSSNALTWSVNGIPNGNATVGTISATGLYTAPVVRPVSASGAAVPIVFAMANASIPNSGSTGAVIELKSGSNFTNFTPGNTITITGNSVAGWNGSFIIVAAATLQDGNFGVQIGNPPGPPASGSGGTATATPNITVTAQVQSTSAIASAIITLDSGIRVSISQPTCTIGTNETLDFASLVTVSGVSNVTVSGTSNQQVTWSLTSGIGAIDPNSGVYTAPATTGTATVTATSVADPIESASATLTIVTAADPTLSSLSPPTAAIGATLQQVYLTGTNFICTTSVLVNGSPLPSGSFFAVSSTTLLVNVPDSVLSTLPTSGSTVTLTVTVERQGGTQQACSSPCQLVLSPVRPAVVAATPDSIQQPSSGTTSFNVTLDGGYFGTGNSPVVNAQFNGNSNGTLQFNSDRQLVLAVPVSDVTPGTGTGPGLYAINVKNKVNTSLMAAVNLAVQPASAPVQLGSPITVGTSPTSVAIDTATGIAVVTNQGSNNITLIDLAAQMAVNSLCTDGSPGPCTATGPVSVAVDNIRNLALVANNTNATLAVIDINDPAVPKLAAPLMSFPSADPSTGNPASLAPRAVGINPVTGRALVAFSSGGGGSNAAAILDLTQSPPALINVVNINNGPNSHIAVSSRLNWALATPGGAGSLSIVDLGRRTVNSISTLSCSSGIVTVNTTGTVGLFAGQPVLISGLTPSTFDGIFSVRSVSSMSFTYSLSSSSSSSCASTTGSSTVAYAQPVATIATDSNLRGVSINDESQKALFANPTNTVPVFVFNILDQSSVSINTTNLVPPFPTTNNVATALNPLTNIGVVINSGGQAFIVDPVTPTVLSPPFTAGASPVDVAIDPATNTAVIVNSGSPGSVNLFSLGGSLRAAPQIAQSGVTPVSSKEGSYHATISSSLSSGATAPDQNVTLVGVFTTTSVPRLDGDNALITSSGLSPAGCGTPPNICRVMKATISGTTLASKGPRQYALDVQDTSASTFSNAARLQVIQAVNLVASCSNPAPQGVAVDIVVVAGVAHNVALVTEPGTASQPCNNVAMIDLANGTGFGAKPELAVGTSPQGVAVYPQAGLAVAANAASNNASIVDIVNDGVAQTITTDPIPTGAAVDPGTGKAVVTANGASVVDVFPVSTTAQTPTTIGVQQEPSGVAIDPLRHLAVVANSSSNTASLLNLTSNSTNSTASVNTVPQGVAFDPITDKFFITSSASNQVIVFDPITGSTMATAPIRVGIGPSSVGYNFASSTLLTANNLSQTVTVVDVLDRTVRATFSLPSSNQFAVDIHPQTNLAVVADPVGNQLLLVPLPY